MINCKRCHRPLTHKDSIARGYGPLCWMKVRGLDPQLANNERPVTRKTLIEIYAPTLAEAYQAQKERVVA